MLWPILDSNRQTLDYTAADVLPALAGVVPRFVGIVGTGKIGTVTARILAGFGCRLLFYDVMQNDECRSLGRFHLASKSMPPAVEQKSDLEATHPGCIALFWAGCGADQNPLPRRTVELAKHYGRRLATAVDEVLLTTKMQPVAPKLTLSFNTIDLPLDKLPSRSEIEMDAKSTNKFVASRARLFLSQLDSGKPLASTYPYPVGVWRIGNDIQFISLGGEVVVDYSIRLKSELSGVKTWVAGYSHDVMAYIPSRRVLTEGGYEGGGAMVYYGLPSPWNEQVESNILAAIRKLLPAK